MYLAAALLDFKATSPPVPSALVVSVRTACHTVSGFLVGGDSAASFNAFKSALDFCSSVKTFFTGFLAFGFGFFATTFFFVIGFLTAVAGVVFVVFFVFGFAAVVFFALGFVATFVAVA